MGQRFESIHVRQLDQLPRQTRAGVYVSRHSFSMLDCAYTCLHSSADFTGVRPTSSKKWFIMQDASSRCKLLEEVNSVFDPLIHEGSWMNLRRVLSRGGLVAFEATIIGSFHRQSFAQVLRVGVWVSRVDCVILFGEMCLCGRWPANISLTQEIKLMDAIDFGLSLCLCRNGCGFWWKLKTIWKQ